MATARKGIRLTHVNHVVYLVHDRERSLRFYRDLLGLREIPSMTPNPDVTWLQLPSGVMVHLVEDKGAPIPERLHSAFEVEDYDAVVAALQALGVRIERSGERKDGQRFLFIRDPDGNLVELCTPSRF
ncbi:MAG: VOC family protein [Chloroflexi bacterium]|nr:VOC family protein [Chloroflexota bacterium]